MTATTWPRTPGYDDVVDLNRYPIGDAASPAYQELVSACQNQLRDQGVAQLAGFLTPAAVSQMLDVASQLAAQAWASDQTHTVYFEPADDSAGPDHPRRELPGCPEGPAGQSGRRPPAAVKPGHAGGLPRPARPAPGHPGHRAAPADQLGADLRRASWHETDRAHPAAVLRPHRLTPGAEASAPEGR